MKIEIERYTSNGKEYVVEREVGGDTYTTINIGSREIKLKGEVDEEVIDKIWEEEQK